MSSEKPFESESIAIGDIIPEEQILTQPTIHPDPLTQLRNGLLQDGKFVRNSKPLDKEANIYFESYILSNRISHGSHDQYDALIHQTRYFFVSHPSHDCC